MHRIGFLHVNQYRQTVDQFMWNAFGRERLGDLVQDPRQIV